MSKSISAANNGCSRNARGIYVRHSSDIFIRNSICIANLDYGIYVAVTNHSSFRSNQVHANQKGIWLSHVDGSDVNENSCLDNIQGIVISDSNGNDVKQNDCSNNSDGIFLETSGYTNISQNECNGNEEDGIELTEASNHNHMDFNNLSGNGERGLYIRSSSILNFADNNMLTGNRIGVRLAKYASNNTIVLNNIFLNTDFGIHAENNGDIVEATNNWWGNSSGPHHAVENPNGSGDNVTDLVVFSPWLNLRVNQPPVAVMVNMGTLLEVEEGDGIQFHGRGDDTDRIVRYVWRSNRDGEFYNGTEAEFKYSDLSVGTHKIYFKVQDEYGAWSDEVSITIVVEKGDEESSTGTILAVVIIVIVAAVGGGVFFLRNK